MARRWTEYQPLDEIARAPRNPKGHDANGIAASMRRHGFVEVPTLDERTGRLVAGHGRLDQLLAAREANQEPPEGVEVGEDGRWLVPVSRGWSSTDDAEAEAYLVGSNALVTAGGWDNRGLAEMLADLQKSPRGLEGTGFTDDYLTDLLASFSPPPSLDDLANNLGDPEDSDFWPVLKLKVPPDVNARYVALVAGFEGDDHERFAAVLAMAECWRDLPPGAGKAAS